MSYVYLYIMIILFKCCTLYVICAHQVKRSNMKRLVMLIDTFAKKRFDTFLPCTTIMFHICGITIEGTVRNGEGQHVGFTTEARLKKASTARLQVDIGKSLA